MEMGWKSLVAQKGMQASVEFALEAKSVQGGECDVGTGLTEKEEGLTQLQARIDWLQRGEQSKTWTNGVSGSVQGSGLFRNDDWDNQDWGKQFVMFLKDRKLFSNSMVQ